MTAMTVRVRVAEQGKPGEVAQAYCDCGWIQLPRHHWYDNGTLTPTQRAEDDAIKHVQETGHLLAQSEWVVDALRSQIMAATSAEALRARGPVAGRS